MRGISLDEISTATKISARNLRSLEEEKFGQLPGGVFNKGFVRAYAKFLGIDEEQMVSEYVAASQEIEAAREQKLHTDLSKAEFKRLDRDREISLEPKSQWGTIAVIVLLAAVGFGGYQFYQKSKAERQAQTTSTATAHVTPPTITLSQSATPAPPVVQPTPTANLTTPDAPATAQSLSSTPSAPSTSSPQPAVKTVPSDLPKTTSTPTASPGVQKIDDRTVVTDSADLKPTDKGVTVSPTTSPIDVKIHANQKSWVSIVADGKTVMEGVLPESSEKAIRANEQVLLVLGNAGGVEVSYNGKTLENLGKGQEVKKLKFTPSGYE
jgi:cytoskeletal protein RodZ